MYNNWEGIDDWNEFNIIDADEGTVLPSWCDSHSQIVYSGSREQEFVDKIKGLSYEEIAKKVENIKLFVNIKKHL